MRSVHRCGFTLVEVLVVVAIIGLLVAMLLPALGDARESARQKECSSRLRELGHACEEYYSSNRMLPFSISHLREGPNPAPQVSGRGWIVPLLPHMDMRNEFKTFVMVGDFQSGGGMADPSVKQRETQYQNIPGLKCPSDPGYDTRITMPEFPGRELATTNYKGCIGDTRLTDTVGTNSPTGALGASIFGGSEPDCHAEYDCNGLFWRNSYKFPHRFERFTEGTSQTFMIGEDIPEFNNNSAWFFANGDWASCHAPLNYFPDPPTPNDWVNVMSFRSNHPGGAFFCFADKHVRFIADDIDIRVYRALSTRDSKKPVKTGEPVLSSTDYN